MDKVEIRDTSERKDIIHVSITSINNWNCMKYYDEIQKIVGPRYDIKFTDSSTKITSDDVTVIRMKIVSDSDINMMALVKAIQKMVEGGLL